MDIHFQIVLYEENLKTALIRLSRKKVYLEKISNEPNYKQSYRDSIREEIEDFEKYIKSAENLIEVLKEFGKQQYSKGHEKGYKEGKQHAEGVVPNKIFDKEKYRAYRHLEVMELWKDHY